MTEPQRLQNTHRFSQTHSDIVILYRLSVIRLILHLLPLWPRVHLLHTYIPFTSWTLSIRLSLSIWPTRWLSAPLVGLGHALLPRCGFCLFSHVSFESISFVANSCRASLDVVQMWVFYRGAWLERFMFIPYSRCKASEQISSRIFIQNLQMSHS